MSRPDRAGRQDGSGDSDFHLAGGQGSEQAGDKRGEAEPRSHQTSVEANTRPAVAEAGPTTPPDMEHEPVTEGELLESQKTAPTADNPTNPTTG